MCWLLAAAGAMCLQNSVVVVRQRELVYAIGRMQVFGMRCTKSCWPTCVNADKLNTDVAIVDSTQTRAFGAGELTGPSPVDRAKPGTKHTLMVDLNGVPLAVKTAGSNRSDQKERMPLIVKVPHIKGKPGRPKD